MKYHHTQKVPLVENEHRPYSQFPKSPRWLLQNVTGHAVDLGLWNCDTQKHGYACRLLKRLLVTPMSKDGPD
ncbi:AAEL015319-PA [Aedes aegypti]|uniref:AAEL015319-PA n=1 Tax=Aedes aegypti TaxID=7159 RepID=Q16E94_AEDAE|nr:AAEL015319-PA [Aedes aegypti]